MSLPYIYICIYAVYAKKIIFDNCTNVKFRESWAYLTCCAAQDSFLSSVKRVSWQRFPPSNSWDTLCLRKGYASQIIHIGVNGFSMLLFAKTLNLLLVNIHYLPASTNLLDLLVIVGRILTISPSPGDGHFRWPNFSRQFLWVHHTAWLKGFARMDCGNPLCWVI